MLGQTKKFFLVVSATLSLLVLFRVITISPVIVEKVVSWCTYPFILAQNSLVVPLQEAVKRRKTVEELTVALQQQQKELDTLRAENRALQATEAHVQQLAEMSSFVERYATDHMVAAQVILKQFSDEAHFFIVDAGTNRGITKDMIAVYNNCLVGRVVEVYPWYAKVVLITDRLSKVPVLCVKTKTQGIHEGENSLTQTKLEFVSHLQPLQQSDLIISSGDGLVYPKGFALGKIRDFSLNSLGLNYVVAIEPVLNMRDINYCYLVAKGAEYTAPSSAS